MTDKTENIIDEDLTRILAAIGLRGKQEQSQNKDDRKLRLSLSGKKARYMWFVLNEEDTKDFTTRNYVTFATGHFLHEWIQDTLSNYGDYKVLHVEGTLTDSFFDDSEGHFDVVAEDWNGKKVLMEIKTTSQYQFVKLDPKNTKKGIFFSSRNFTFEPWSLVDEPFNYTWLYQGGSYLYELVEQGEEIDRVIYLVVNKNTGHIAVGKVLNEQFTKFYDLVDDRVQEWDKAIEADSKDELDYCWDLSDGIPIQCQYCNHIDNCLDYTVTYNKGKPVFKLNK